MRKFKIAVVVAGGLLLSIGLLAQEKTKVQDRQTVQESTQTQMGDAPVGHSMNYIDENANGICDRFEQHAGGQQTLECGMGHCQNSIDKNGDGVCDDRSSGGMHGNRGSGYRNGQGHGHEGQGRNH